MYLLCSMCIIFILEFYTYKTIETSFIQSLCNVPCGYHLMTKIFSLITYVLKLIEILFGPVLIYTHMVCCRAPVGLGSKNVSGNGRRKE